MEFKVGDKLRFKAASNEYYTQGDVYEVVDYDEGNDLYTLKLDDGVDFWHTKDVRECFQHIDEQQPQVTKVKLTQEQARALENVMKDNDIECVITAHAEPGKWMSAESRALNELSVADVARAVLIGYEVEQTAKEKVLVAYEAAERMLNAESRKDEKSYESGFWWGKINGMKFVLNTYGIKVKGINDND